MADSTDHSEQSREQAEHILSNFRQYSNYLDRAEALYERGALASAAVQCAVAAHLAVQNHCGVFWSPRAEKLLTEIARRTETPGPKHPRPREFKRILNVVTKVEAVGGHTKMLCLWVDADAGREHTLVMTGHSGPTPDRVTQAFERSGGGVRYLNRSAGDLLDRARRLRRMAQDFDLVVLHTYCEDVVPLLAFGDTGSGKYPNVLLLNHADHLFWFGPGVTHLNINLRDAAQDLSIARRGIAPERNILMPTISESVTRTRSREEAKRELGISPDTVLMVSVARRLKYKTLNGVTYADIHAPILERHPDVSMIVVGAGDQPEWEPVRAKVGNRLRTTPQIPDPGIYFEAADIYLDSFPFVSSTSMM
ncbi:MAG: glycosyl transferase family 1, partial [Deltaproteobacteria bacterium]